MDKEISKNLFEVENPVYMDYDDMIKKYTDYVVVVTNLKKDEDGDSMGGIVRFYTKESRELYSKWGEYENSGKYGKCTIKHFISGVGSLGGLYL